LFYPPGKIKSIKGCLQKIIISPRTNSRARETHPPYFQEYTSIPEDI